MAIILINKMSLIPPDAFIRFRIYDIISLSELMHIYFKFALCVCETTERTNVVAGKSLFA